MLNKAVLWALGLGKFLKQDYGGIYVLEAKLIKIVGD